MRFRSIKLNINDVPSSASDSLVSSSSQSNIDNPEAIMLSDPEVDLQEADAMNSNEEQE